MANYKKIYNSFISRCQSRKEPKTDFVELFYIRPICVGGENIQENIVKLTPRECYFAYQLLLRISKDEERALLIQEFKSVHSITLRHRRLTSKQYELIKEVVYKILQYNGKEYPNVLGIQEDLINKYADIKKIIERGVCKSCGVRSKAINYNKNGRTFYRLSCDICLAGKNKLKIPQWKKDRYLKKSSCEKCGFLAKFSEQLSVIIDNKHYKTVCLNCQMEITLNHKTKILRPVADY